MAWRHNMKAKRCADKGHRYRTVTRMGFMTECGGLSYRCVADSVEQTAHVCRRCGTATEWVTVSRRCLTGLTMDTPSYNRLHRDGQLWR